jgi:hypothetical protein
MNENLIEKKIGEYQLLIGQLAILCHNLRVIKTDLITLQNPQQRIKEFESKEARTFDYMRRLLETYTDYKILTPQSEGYYEQL